MGHLIDNRRGGWFPTFIRSFPLTDSQVTALVEMDVTLMKNSMRVNFPWVFQLDEVRMNVVLSMGFQLGMERLKRFSLTLPALMNKEWDRAASHMRNSLVYRAQARERWERFARMIETGEFV